MRFRVLGPVEARADNGDLVPLAAKPRALLAVLLLNTGRPVSRERLMAALWPAQPPRSADGVLRTYLSALRQELGLTRRGGLPRLEPLGGSYRIEAAPGDLDLLAFGDLAERGCQALAEGAAGAAVVLLDEALGLWRGQPAQDVSLDPQTETELAGLAERRLVAEEARAEAGIALGHDVALVARLRLLVGEYPLRERLWELLMTTLYRTGQQAAALAAYQQLRAHLVGELGIEPGPGLRELHQQVLAGDRLQAAGGRLPGAALTGQPAPPPSPLEVRYSLPPDSAAFTGRDTELDWITTAVTDTARAGGVVAIHAFAGMPGIGKTTLAVHAAHRLRAEFPARQLFIDLHAHTPGREPVRPEDALAGLLGACGVDPRQLPADLDGRAALWRDRMAGQRALLVLDNAASSGQVTPLLPGSEGCLVLVTSRRHLGDLPGTVAPLVLDGLPPQQAIEMFIRLAPRAAGSPGEVAEVVRLAGFLPLAVSLLARVSARHPAWTLADLAAETRAGLLALTAEDDSVAAAFEVSYRHLDPAQQWLFRLLGAHPGVTHDMYAAAALAETSVTEAARLLDRLHGEGLLTETGHRRYGMHDLLRRYARDQAGATPAEAQRALERLLDYYQHTAGRADAHLARLTRPGPAPTATAPPPAAPDLENAGQALAWARAERASLVACLDHATGQDTRVTALTAALAGLLVRDGPWTEAITRHTTAIQAARRLGDRLSEANALTNLGDLQRLMGDHPAAAQSLEQALDTYRGIGDRLGQANALTYLGDVWWLMGDYPAAVQAIEQALGTYRDLGDRRGQAHALTYLGDVRQLMGDYPGGVQALEQALGTYRDLGDQLGQAHALTYLGDLQRLMGDHLGAAQSLEAALSISRDLGDRRGQAHALTHLGDVRRQTGDYPAAAQNLEAALEIYRDLGDRRAEALALTFLGILQRYIGEYSAAARNLDAALEIYRDLGDRGGEVESLNERGTLHLASGDLTRAQECHQQALELARAIASPWDEAHALAGLGRCATTTSHTAQARSLLRQAQEIFQRIGAAEARAVLADLTALEPENANQSPCEGRDA
ncbi:MAG TPA: tetratricopeptide repeat protein [Streptosporangiaceae bacterium]|nr:tetratricopeptide repeat protein [Streptosporangiaceae bacterium]